VRCARLPDFAAGACRAGLAALVALVALAGVGALAPVGAGAQGSCEVNNQATCTAGGDAAHSITVTISVATRLTVPATIVAVPGPTSANYEVGFGTAVNVPVSVWANSGWAIALSTGTPLWSGTPGSARQDKPAADLQWGTTSIGPFTDASTTPVSVQTGAPIGGGVVPLFLRARFQWALDTPGSYEIPVQLTITAP
jgi:hypothetical protein